jgi:hypothetical protein
VYKNCLLLIALIIGSHLSINGNAQTNIEGINWDKIMNAAQTYFASPTSENALKFFASLPNTAVLGEARETEEFHKVFYYIYNKLDILERLVLKADGNAVKVAVRLGGIGDGAFSEWLDEMLGDLIRVDPKMFLEEIRKYPWPDGYGDFKDWLAQCNVLCNGRVLSGDSEASDEDRREELELRIKALETVKDANLMGFRDECIAILRKHISEYYRQLEDDFLIIL